MVSYRYHAQPRYRNCNICNPLSLLPVQCSYCSVRAMPMLRYILLLQIFFSCSHFLPFPLNKKEKIPPKKRKKGKFLDFCGFIMAFLWFYGQLGMLGHAPAPELIEEVSLAVTQVVMLPVSKSMFPSKVEPIPTPPVISITVFSFAK